MSFRTTLILLVILALAGGAVYVLEARSGQQAAAEKEKLQVFKFEQKEVRLLEATGKDKTTTLEKDDQGVWWLRPQGEKADRVKVESVISRLSDLRALKRLAEKVDDSKQYGLDNPTVKILISRGQDKQNTLTVGAETPLKEGYYGTHDNDPSMYLMGQFLVSDLRKLVEEPPFEPTPTPIPIPTATPSESPTPAPAATAAPAATLSPTTP